MVKSSRFIKREKYYKTKQTTWIRCVVCSVERGRFGLCIHNVHFSQQRENVSNDSMLLENNLN